MNERKNILEALLFSTNKLLGPEDICEVFAARSQEISRDAITEVIVLLNEEYKKTGRSFSIIAINEKYRICTNPEFGDWVKELLQVKTVETLSKPALETLAIIAYRQPIIKMEIEAVRGVSVDGVLKKLIELHLVEIAGKKDIVGKPFLYRTTDKFLDYFGLKNLDELPARDELIRTFEPNQKPEEISEEKKDEDYEKIPGTD